MNILKELAGILKKEKNNNIKELNKVKLKKKLRQWKLIIQFKYN